MALSPQHFEDKFKSAASLMEKDIDSVLTNLKAESISEPIQIKLSQTSIHDEVKRIIKDLYCKAGWKHVEFTTGKGQDQRGDTYPVPQINLYRKPKPTDNYHGYR
jgi:hypothetical protein